MAEFLPYVSFREEPGGGAVARQGNKKPEMALTRFDTLVLLIHGFNNDLEGATRAYVGFRKLQVELGSLSANLLGIFWPGDNWSGPLFYMQSIEQARETAAVLAEELRKAARARGFLRIDVVAHSMGCRLSLELLTQLLTAPEPGLVVRRFAFMAAAVPVFTLEPSDPKARRPFRDSLDRSSIEGLLSLFSPHDNVLSLAFPLGQSLASGPEGFLPTALGRHRWTGPGVLPASRLDQQEVKGAGHSDYWGWKEKSLDRAREANRQVRSFLGLGDLPPRELPVRETSVRETTEARETRSPRTSPGRLATA